MGAGIERAPPFLHRHSCAHYCCQRLIICFMLCDAQACDPMDEASRWQTFMNEPVDVSKKSWRLAPFARELAAAWPRCSVWQPPCMISTCTGVPWLVWACTESRCSAGVPMVGVQVHCGGQHARHGSQTV